MPTGPDNTAPAASAPAWLRLSPWSVVFILLARIARFIRENIPLLLGAGVGAAVFEGIGPAEIALASAVLVLIASVTSIIHYRRFRFRLDDGVLVVQRGLLERQELKLQAGRIQHISIQQPLYMRPFGLVRFGAETPGSAAAEIELPGIRRDIAQHLRDRLSDTGEDSGATFPSPTVPSAPPESPILFRITPRDLTLHGLASNYAYVMAAALSPFLHRIERFFAEHLEQTDIWERLVTATGSPFATATLVVAALVLSLVTISVIVSWLRFHGFVLTRENGRFAQRSGLLNRQEQILDPAKLQAVEWIQTAVGRAVRRGHLICRQFGAAAVPQETGNRTFLVPGLDPGRARRLSGEFWPQVTPDVSLNRVHPFYRRSLFIRIGLIITAFGGALSAASREPVWLLGLAGVLCGLWLLVYQHWRTVGWAIDRHYAYFRNGLLGRRLIMFPPQNAQRVELTQSWFQRRRKVATVTLSLPSGTVVFPFLPETDARFLVNVAAYRIESG